MKRWLSIIMLSLMWAHGPILHPSESPNTSDLNHRLLISHWADILREAKETIDEIQGYVGVLRSIAEDPPINDEVSDSIAYATAFAIYEDARITGLPGSFYLGLIRVENPQLDPYITNWYGAVGLTQVVPKFWLGVFPECGDDLHGNIYTQICYGARVYMHYLDTWEDETLALYAYNGCTQYLRDRRARCTNFPTWVQNYALVYQRELD